MTTLLLGANGQLGRHLRSTIAPLTTCARDRADHYCNLEDFNALDKVLDAVRPEVIINAAAWTAVDDAEDLPDSAFQLNRDLPAHLADWCRGHDALLIHYSTDYVFSGNPGRPWCEEDQTGPESVYGLSKLGGEQAVLASRCRSLVVRTAWLYSALPGNFLSAILARAGQGERLRVVNDQTGSPTWAGTLAAATAQLLEETGARVQAPTVVHVASKGAATWHELAVCAVQMAAERGIIPEAIDIESIGSDAWPQKAARPAWSVLDVSRYERMTGCTLPAWRDALADCLDQWKNAPC